LVKEITNMTRYDIAVIGTGPAGLEAAITAKVRNKNIILFGNKELSNKMQVVDHPILNYLGLPSVTGKEMAAAFKKAACMEDGSSGFKEHGRFIGDIDREMA
jgi:thioredoxin reductase